MTTAENTGVTTREPEKTGEEMLNAIRACGSDLAIFDNEHDGEDVEDDEEDTELNNLSNDNEPR
jgi:hypothetical protein